MDTPRPPTSLQDCAEILAIAGLRGMRDEENHGESAVQLRVWTDASAELDADLRCPHCAPLNSD
jgi:hypothetical protein